jgi:hypothetical protein
MGTANMTAEGNVSKTEGIVVKGIAEGMVNKKDGSDGIRN